MNIPTTVNGRLRGPLLLPAEILRQLVTPALLSNLNIKETYGKLFSFGTKHYALMIDKPAIFCMVNCGFRPYAIL